MKDWEFELKQCVEIKVSGEIGNVIGRAEYSNGLENGYMVHYKAADGRAVTSWFDVSMLKVA